MQSMTSDATLNLARAIERCDVGLAQQALASGANPNERMVQSMGWTGSALAFMAKQIRSPEDFDQWEPMARLLLAPAAAASVKTQAEFVSRCMKRWEGNGLDWALRVGVPSQVLFERVSRLGVQVSLFDAAVLHGKDELAVRLWDEFGVAPEAAGDCFPTRSSSLVSACRGDPGLAVARPLWRRLLDLPWPQQDLDAALRRSVGSGNAVIVEQLLELGANPNFCGEEDGPLSALVQYLGALGGESCPEMVYVLAKHGANLDEKVDFSVGLVSGVQHLKLSAAPASQFVPDHHDVSLLALACVSKSQDGALALLELGADVSHPTREGNTPLHLLALSPWAVSTLSDPSSSTCILTALLEAGANVLAKNNEGLTPLEAWLSYCFPSGSMIHSAPASARRWVWATLDADPSLLGPVSALALQQPHDHPLFDVVVDTINRWQLRARLEGFALESHPAPPPRVRM